MHLLKIEHGGSLQDSGEAVDLGQPPGDIVILTSADTEIAMLSDAVASLNAERAGADSNGASRAGARAGTDSGARARADSDAKSPTDSGGAKGRDANTKSGTPAKAPGNASTKAPAAAPKNTRAAPQSTPAATSPAHRPEFRIASTLSLGHPFSVDRYIEDTISGARLVIARLLGGSAYWSYGTQRLTELAATGAVKLALVAGDARGDPELDRLSNLAPGQCARLAAYLDAGGPQNARGFLMAAMDILNGTDDAPPPRQLLRAGIYWPDTEAPDLASVASNWKGGAPTAAIIFYRALVQAGDLAPVDQVIASCQKEGLNPLPLFCASLKDPESAAIIESLLGQTDADIILNMTSFAVSDPAAMSAQPAIAPQRAGNLSAVGAADAAAAAGDSPNTPIPHTHPGPLKSLDAPILQLVLSASQSDEWRASPAGLTARDIAMNVALPELDGRVLARAVGFKRKPSRHPATHAMTTAFEPAPDRADFTAALAANWARLRDLPAARRRVALIMANYPNRDGRLGNGVGLDTPESVAAAMKALKGEGYKVAKPPRDGAHLISNLRAGPTNAGWKGRTADPAATLELATYKTLLAALPKQVQKDIKARWGAPKDDPMCAGGVFRLPVRLHGNLVVCVQPARGYNIDPKATYHSPDLVPPHNYLAMYLWLRHVFGANAIVHFGKHGNLEWLPGKALALGASCLPEAILGPTPHLYPFIVNDPGEGAQAKRRTQAVIIDHLTPPMTQAESHGVMAELEAQMDEYYEAAGMDAARSAALLVDILETAERAGIATDCGMDKEADPADKLTRLDNYLCDLKELQIRDGLHCFGTSPTGRFARDLIAQMLRIPRDDGQGANASLLRALARDLDMNAPADGAESCEGKKSSKTGNSRARANISDTPGSPARANIPDSLASPTTPIADPFDPLTCERAAPWHGPKPGILADAGPEVSASGTTPAAGVDSPGAAGPDASGAAAGGVSSGADTRSAGKASDAFNRTAATSDFPVADSPAAKGANASRASNGAADPGAGSAAVGPDSPASGASNGAFGPGADSAAGVAPDSPVVPSVAANASGTSNGAAVPATAASAVGTDSSISSASNGIGPDSQSPTPWRTAGDTVERLDRLARDLVAGTATPPGPASRAVIEGALPRIRAGLDACGQAEMDALTRGLSGRFIGPGPSGAPTRGRPEVLPTGRNFYSLDSRALPTPVAWRLGWASAEALVERHLMDNGNWPRAVALSAWGTSNMRTGGDDMAQALALLGVRPTWDANSRRVTGFEVIPLDVLARPRVDVCLRCSGFFRDAFPAQMTLFDRAVRKVAELDEPPEMNPLAATVKAETARYMRAGATREDAARQSTYRIFSAKPGSYGAGLQALMDEGLWEERADFAEAFLVWSSYAYGEKSHGTEAREALQSRLAGSDAVIHNQDNREHDILDSDDYYQFAGGLSASVAHLAGRDVPVYHNDHSLPERPVVRTLGEEIGRVVRARASNPKWIEGAMRHGYKGAFEMAATVDYLFAFAATTRQVAEHHFTALFEAYVEDERVRAFLESANDAAWHDMVARFTEAIERGLWAPRRNSIPEMLTRLGEAGAGKSGGGEAGEPASSAKPSPAKRSAATQRPDRTKPVTRKTVSQNPVAGAKTDRANRNANQGTKHTRSSDTNQRTKRTSKHNANTTTTSHNTGERVT